MHDMCTTSYLVYHIWWSWSLIHRFAGCLFYKSVNLDISICIIKKQFFLNLLYFDPLPNMTFLSMKICIRKKWTEKMKEPGANLRLYVLWSFNWNTNNNRPPDSLMVHDLYIGLLKSRNGFSQCKQNISFCYLET